MKVWYHPFHMANKGTKTHNTQQASKDCSKQQVFRLHTRWIMMPLLPKLL